MQQQRIEYQDVFINQLTQEGMRQLVEAGYGVLAQSVHNKDVLIFARVAPPEVPQIPAPHAREEESSPNGRDGEIGERLYARDELRAAADRALRAGPGA